MVDIKWATTRENVTSNKIYILVIQDLYERNMFPKYFRFYLNFYVRYGSFTICTLMTSLPLKMTSKFHNDISLYK